MTKIVRGEANKWQQKHAKWEESRKSFSSHESHIKFKGLGSKKIKTQPFDYRLYMNSKGVWVIISKVKKGWGVQEGECFFKKCKIFILEKSSVRPCKYSWFLKK